MDADPNWRKAFSHEPASERKLLNFKHDSNGLPVGPNASSDHFIDLVPGMLALRIYVLKAASGADTSTYQLHVKTTDRTGTILGSSTLAQFKDLHTIDLSNVDLTGISRICLCADGTWNTYAGGGIAFIEYI